MKFACPQCDQHISVSDAHAGVKLHCPACGHELQVPSAQPVRQPPVIPQAVPPVIPAPQLEPAGARAEPAFTPTAVSPDVSAPLQAPDGSDAFWEEEPPARGKACFLATSGPKPAGPPAVPTTVSEWIGWFCALPIALFIWAKIGGFLGIFFATLFMFLFRPVFAAFFTSFDQPASRAVGGPKAPVNAYLGSDQPVCDFCRASMRAPGGYLFSTSQVVAAPKFWEAYWRHHRKAIRQLALDRGVVLPPVYAGVAFNFNRFSAVHFVWHRIAQNRQPWLCCHECARMFPGSHSASRREAMQWWESHGAYAPSWAGPAELFQINLGGAAMLIKTVGGLTLLILGGIFLFTSLTVAIAGKAPIGSRLLSAAITFGIGLAVSFGGWRWWKS